MARKPGKKYTAAARQLEARPHSLDEAVPLVQKLKYAKFDETIEVHMRLGVDPKHADPMVRGSGFHALIAAGQAACGWARDARRSSLVRSW